MRLELKLMAGKGAAVPADCWACRQNVPAAARKVTAAVRPRMELRRFPLILLIVLIVVCIFLWLPFSGSRFFYGLNPIAARLLCKTQEMSFWMTLGRVFVLSAGQQSQDAETDTGVLMVQDARWLRKRRHRWIGNGLSQG